MDSGNYRSIHGNPSTICTLVMHHLRTRTRNCLVFTSETYNLITSPQALEWWRIYGLGESNRLCSGPATKKWTAPGWRHRIQCPASRHARKGQKLATWRSLPSAHVPGKGKSHWARSNRSRGAAYKTGSVNFKDRTCGNTPLISYWYVRNSTDQISSYRHVHTLFRCMQHTLHTHTVNDETVKRNQHLLPIRACTHPQRCQQCWNWLVCVHALTREGVNSNVEFDKWMHIKDEHEVK